MPAPNTFAGGELDRAAERRGDERWLAERLADPASVALVAGADELYVTGDPPRPALVPLDGARRPLLLGLDGERALFAVDSADIDSAALGDAAALGLREAGALLSQADGGLAAYAAALLNWHRRHGFCSVCGSPTEVGDAGHVRRCPNCGAQHHPRTDPVVIVLVTAGDRVLLGRQPRWPPGRYSALAGFVEPGESLEEAVAREVGEEAGIEVADIEYRSSQPWPFPLNLMLGFTARHVAGAPATLDRELEDVRWFERTELAAAVAGTAEIHVPPPLAIARRLIDGWLAGQPG